MSDRPRAVILLSGGVDSATAAALTAREGYALYALSLAYGQRHAAELDSARRVARALGAARHEILTIDLRAVGGSALTADLAVPKDRDEKAMGADIPVTYVPARNTIFLAFALAWAEVLEASATKTRLSSPSPTMVEPIVRTQSQRPAVAILRRAST